MTVIDRVFEYFAPVMAAKRENARARISALRAARNYYDGADLGRRGASIRRSAASSETITARTLPALRNGSRDLVRNNPHAHRGVNAIDANVIGTGIRPRFKRANETVRDLQDLALDALETPLIDAAGQQNYYGLQSLICKTVVESGECLVVRQWVRDSFPLRVQVLEPEFLDTSRDTYPMRGGERTSQGITYDSNGRRVGYWIYPEHPGGKLRQVESTFVPARDVIHIYRMERPGQIRGIPWLAPVMLRSADFSDYEEAQLVRQKIASCFVATVNDAQAPLPGTSQDSEERIEEVEPGMIIRTSPTSQTTFGQPQPITDYKDYAKVSLRAIAAGLGVGYEALTGDLEGVNFSSGRMGWLEFQRNIDKWRWHTFIGCGFTPMMGWFLDAAALTGIDVSGVRVRHNPPKREMISPEREVPARVKELASGQRTLREHVEQVSGRDLEEHLDEMREVQEMVEERGLNLDWLTEEQPQALIPEEVELNE